jgi:glycosyltransferase involved in cell wall biosynthesis
VGIALQNTNRSSGQSVSILVLTFNEEPSIRTCLASVAWSDDIVVLDSHSTDRTVAIAESLANVRVVERTFDDYSRQRNYGLHQIPFKNKWVFILDADEECPPELGCEILEAVNAATPGIGAFRLRRKNCFLGSFLSHGKAREVWLERLVRPGFAHFEGILHEKPVIDGIVVPLHHYLIHNLFDKGITHWLQRRNIYSSLAARMELEQPLTSNFEDAFSSNPVIRRRWLNSVYRRLPGRWLVFFLYHTFITLSFLDGIKGMQVLLLETFYEYLIVVKRDELKETSRVQKSLASRSTSAV